MPCRGPAPPLARAARTSSPVPERGLHQRLVAHRARGVPAPPRGPGGGLHAAPPSPLLGLQAAARGCLLTWPSCCTDALGCLAPSPSCKQSSAWTQAHPEGRVSARPALQGSVHPEALGLGRRAIFVGTQTPPKKASQSLCYPVRKVGTVPRCAEQSRGRGGAAGDRAGGALHSRPARSPPSPPWRRATQAPGSAVVFSTPRGPRPRCRGASLALDGTSAPGAAACGAVSTGARSPGWATGGDDPAHRSPPALWASRAGPCVALPEGTRLPSAGSPSRARSAPCPPKQVRNQTQLRSGSEMPALGNQARLLLNSSAAPWQRLRVDTGINPR